MHFNCRDLFLLRHNYRPIQVIAPGLLCSDATRIVAFRVTQFSAPVQGNRTPHITVVIIRVKRQVQAAAYGKINDDVDQLDDTLSLNPMARRPSVSASDINFGSLFALSANSSIVFNRPFSRPLLTWETKMPAC